MKDTIFVATKRDDTLLISLVGVWSTVTLKERMRRIYELIATVKNNIAIDFSDVSIDSASALFFRELKKERQNIKLVGFCPKTRSLFRLLIQNTDKSSPKNESAKVSIVESVGKAVSLKIEDFLAYSEFLGRLIGYSGGLLRRRNMRFVSIAKHIQSSSISALPIVALSAFLIGIVVTYQGALQLEKFGAAIFTVDLAGISIARELAPLLTAVVIAGRSGASYTSEIGVMKITEEIDAMRSMGFSPYYFLAFPRILALTLTLWLVIFFADAVAIFGAMVVAKLQLGITYGEFLDRLQTTLALKHVLVGLAKAPFFAFLIASIGIFRGLQVQKNSESIGIMTTHSVVNSIFAVIACDALFAILFTRIGV